MNSYDFNSTMAQNQRPLYPNYIPGLNANPVQVPNSINKSSGNTPQYGLLPPIKTYPNLQGYNPVNMIPSQINQTHQILGSKSNFITSPHIQNAIQPQVVIKTTPNMIYNPNINTNLINTNQNQIPIRNNINIPYNINIISNQNMIQGKSNQVLPLYESNINNQNLKQNITISENNLTQNKIKNELANKNSIVQNERTKEILNGHPAVPVILTIKAMQSICKITYNYDNEEKFGTGFFMKFSDSLKLLITNYHVLNPQLMNIKIQIEIWNNKTMILNLKERYIKFMEIQDITAIEIKEKDEIYKYIQFLNYDFNYYHNYM